MSTLHSHETLPSSTVPVVERKLAVLFAAALGLVIVFAAGFAPSEVVHNAAHDTRHAFAFPCH